MKVLPSLVAASSLVAGCGAFVDVGGGGPRRAARPLAPSVPEASSSALHANTWNNGGAYGKGEFTMYKSFEDWMKPFPAEDREEYPELFVLPEGVYERRLARPAPLGIVFEEREVGGGGVFVKELFEDGNAKRLGVEEGDELVGVTAIKVVGAKWERRLLPCSDWSFDMVLGAIGSNEPKWNCEDVVLMFKRPGEADDEKVAEFMSFFEPPLDSMWRK